MILPGLRGRSVRSGVVKNNVRFGLGIFLFLLVYDGAIRKWLVNSAEQLVFITKDVLLVALIMVALSRGTRTMCAKIPSFVQLPLWLYVIWVVGEAVNPNLPNLLVGIWGGKSHLLYAGLILLVPCAFVNLDDLFKTVSRIYPWIVVPVCGLAFLQLMFPADSIINQQVRGGIDSIAHFGETNLVRVAGTFSYISGMAAFVQVIVLLGVALFLWGARSRFFLLGLGFALVTLPATGSRGVVVISAVGGVMMILAGLLGRITTARIAIRAIGVLAVLMVVSLVVQDTAWQALAERAAGSRGDEGRAITAFTNAFDHMDQAGLIGFGAGAANLAAVALVSYVSPFSWLPAGTVFEEESGRMVLELGVFGWALNLLMRVAMLWWALSLLVRGASRSIRAAAVLVLPIMALAVHQGNGVFAPPVGAVYFWFCVAILAMAQYEHNRINVKARSHALRSRAIRALR